MQVRFTPSAEKYLKKLKDKKLKELFKTAIKEIVKDPFSGKVKSGDLKDIYTYDFRYDRSDYRVAYLVEKTDDELILIIMAGTRENFYKELKKYWK